VRKVSIDSCIFKSRWPQSPSLVLKTISSVIVPLQPFLIYTSTAPKPCPLGRGSGDPAQYKPRANTPAVRPGMRRGVYFGFPYFYHFHCSAVNWESRRWMELDTEIPGVNLSPLIKNSVSHPEFLPT
jgi:hypothetical protein